MKKYITETQRIILKVYVINLLIYLIKFPVNFKYRSIHRWCSLNSYKVRNIHRKTSVLESLFNKFIGLQACNFTKKRVQHRRFTVNIANFKNTYIEKHLRMAGSDSSYILHSKLNKIIQEVDWSSRLAFCFSWNIKSLYFTYSHSYSFVLSLAVIRCYSLSFFVTRCHLLSFVVTCCTTSCHSLSLVVSLVVIRCATRCHSLYHLLSFVATPCHSMSLDVITHPSFYKGSLFYNFLLFTSFIFKTKTKQKIVSLKF